MRPLSCDEGVWILVTFDDDFLSLVEGSGLEHTGIIYVQQAGRNIGDVVKAIDAHLEQRQEADRGIYYCCCREDCWEANRLARSIRRGIWRSASFRSRGWGFFVRLARTEFDVEVKDIEDQSRRSRNSSRRSSQTRRFDRLTSERSSRSTLESEPADSIVSALEYTLGIREM